MFHHALAHAPASRALFLDKECATNHTLGAEVERLLAAHGRAATLGTPPLAAFAAPARRRPDRIGAYQIVDTLGEGGFGVVYRAQHTSTGTKVALKTISNVHESV